MLVKELNDIRILQGIIDVQYPWTVRTVCGSRWKAFLGLVEF